MTRLMDKLIVERLVEKVAAPRTQKDEYLLVEKELKRNPDNVPLRERWHQLRERLGMGSRIYYVQDLLNQLKDYDKLSRWYESDAFDALPGTHVILEHGELKDLDFELDYMRENSEYYPGLPENEDEQYDYVAQRAEWYGDPQDLHAEFKDVMKAVNKTLYKYQSRNPSIDEEYGLEQLLLRYKDMKEKVFPTLKELWEIVTDSNREPEQRMRHRQYAGFVEKAESYMEGARKWIDSLTSKISDGANDEIESYLEDMKDAIQALDDELTSYFQTGYVPYQGLELDIEEIEGIKQRIEQAVESFAEEG